MAWSKDCSPSFMAGWRENILIFCLFSMCSHQVPKMFLEFSMCSHQVPKMFLEFSMCSWGVTWHFITMEKILFVIWSLLPAQLPALKGTILRFLLSGIMCNVPLRCWLFLTTQHLVKSFPAIHTQKTKNTKN